MSALARLDLDAWAEAAALARLPRNVAVLRLSGLLRKYVEILQITQEAELVAARLIALLPEGATPRALHKAPSRLAAALGGAGLGMLIALGVMIGLQFAGPSPSPHKGRGGGIVRARGFEPGAGGKTSVMRSATLPRPDAGPPAIGTVRHFAPHQTIFAEGEPAAHFMLVIHGMVRSCSLFPDGRRFIRRVLCGRRSVRD